jgi:thioredoxin-like negative regulator of GroEL
VWGALGLVLALGAPSAGHATELSASAFAQLQASAPDDDWSLEHGASDPALVGQRFAKLRRAPFDRAQWRALEKAIGRDALARRISSALAKDPDDFALLVLSARASMAAGKPADAAQALAKVEAKAGRRAGQVFGLRIEALQAAGDHAGAIAALEAKAKSSSGKAKAAWLAKAAAAAERGGMEAKALELVQAIVDASPNDVEQRLRLARAASRAGAHDRADKAFAEAESRAKARERDEIAIERARARLDAGKPGEAAAVVWKLLEDPKRGSRAARESRWELLVEAQRRAGQTDDLVATLRGWLESHTGEAAAWRALATAKESAGQDASEAWRHALELDPKDGNSHGALIDILQAKGDHTAAIAEYKRLAARQPGEYERGLDLAARLLRADKRELGLALAREIEDRVGRRAQAQAALLEFYNLNEEPELALAVANRMTKASPRSAEARISLGEQLFQMGRTQEALTQWAMLPKLVRPAHRGWARHAEVLGEHNLVSDAIASLKVALKLAPHEPSYVRLRAVFAEEQRRPPVALELWQQVRVLAKGPEHRLLRDEARTRVVELLVEGAIPARMEKIASAETEARTIFEKGEPLDEAIEAGRFLAELHTRRELYANAVAVHKQLVKLQPKEPDRLAELAAAQRRAGQPEDAIATLEELLALDPSRRAEVLAELSELAFEAGDSDRALSAAKDAAQAGPHQVDALVRLGELHEREGDVTAAIAAYEKAREADPDDGRAYLRLADLEVARGKLERAAGLLQTVIDKGTPADLVREAGRRALDLGEVKGGTLPLLDLAVRRTTAHPQAEEAREFLVDALDRTSAADVETWLVHGAKGKGGKGGKRDSERMNALRAPLLAALGRGSVSLRARAADRLGDLRLPETALPLARAAVGLTAPRDATPTVREAYDRARVSALRAAGKQRDAAANTIFASVLEQGTTSLAARQAAAWALAGDPDAQAARVLAGELDSTGDPVMLGLACLGLGGAGEHVTGDARRRIASLARAGRPLGVRHACALAEAELAKDDELAKIAAQLDSDDPVLAAIAAWRRGRLAGASATASAAVVQDLFVALVGPAGLRRDAAAAALARLLDGKPSAKAPLDRPPAPRTRDSESALERWIARVVAPSFDPLPRSAITGHADALAGALRTAAAGTRAERAAAQAARTPCADERAATNPATESGATVREPLCLRPLVRETIELSNGRSTRPR